MATEVKDGAAAAEARSSQRLLGDIHYSVLRKRFFFNA
jgi:hypothetical protein